MIKRSIFATIILVLLVLDSVSAQQDAQYTQYMFNTLAVNPAYAGSRGQLSVAALYRSQWVGLEGSPKTQTFNLHSPIRNSNLGYGISIVNDQIGDGVVQETYFDGTVSYTLKLAQDRKLSFGLKVGGNLLNLDFEKLRKIDDEVVETDNIDNRFSPNFGLGFYYHTNKFYLGLSAPNLVETDHFDNSNRDSDDVQFLSKDKVNLYAITGYVFDLNNTLKFKPAVLTKVVSGAPLQVDLSANFMFNEKFTFGAAYRWDAAVSAMAGFQLSDQLMLGLAYDKETTELGGTQFNDGSFEVFMRFELVRAFEKLVSPRFF
ncbi:PorP/SprF family type IX secretion system membrane protein [Cellulophaga omnivescoria]|uniref:PorP/SprF family type IX secretion system membrane protein n=1 Tax=Cellulophaga omnivescoria TaxID=1888890 RepID=UPI0022EFE926|nr:type IX secretion system membrane protein PorP/SprF [Cellulophaga omnivescoria]WBU89916.1 type IX secretion system membrane protein PorP/SprF [Cellulophaga omnivescoria]WKB82039.1 type IX secretion system membrane protein PorP/SprF [Cellulophaga lytica]